MKFRNILAAAAVAALPLTAQAAQIVIPAAGSGAGANGSHWQTELTVHSAAPRSTSLAISFRQGSTVTAPVTVELGARETLSIADIVGTKFHATGSGALIIEVADREARGLALTSRTKNVLGTVEYGQDIPAVNAVDALRAGDNGTLPGAADAASTRFNFGVYALDAATIEWQLVRANGTVAGTKVVSYAAASHAQHNSGIESLLGLTRENDDTLYARVQQGRAIVYGSIVNASGDPTFVPGTRTRDDITIHFAGLDLDENGTVDVRDENGDGVLDQTIDLYTSLFPNHFRIVAEGEFGEAVQFEVVKGPDATDLIDANGSLRVAPGAALQGTTGTIEIKATSGTSFQILVIPVRYR